MAGKRSGLMLEYTTEGYIALQKALEDELVRRAVAEKVTKSAEETLTRDILPKTDFAGSWGAEEWWYDLSSGTINTHNQVVANVDLDREKIIGIFGVKKRGEDIVSALKFKRGDAETIDVWQLNAIGEGEIAVVESVDNAIIYNSRDKVNIYDYISEVGVAGIVLLGKVAEKKGKTVSGAK